MASIALKRTDSFSSASGSNSNNQLNASDLGYGDHQHHPHSHSGGARAGLYGNTLASLQYQPHAPSSSNRGPSAYHRQDSEQSNLGYGYGGGDDMSLVGECDGSSIRSDKYRPDRRASLSAAIELTREPLPKRNTTSASRPRGRRNSLFGNNKRDEDEGFSKPARSPPRSKSGGALLSKIGRRASMGCPAEELKGAQPLEPEPTPQFFHKRKGGTPRRKGSHDKNDPRSQHVTSQLRPGEKIKRPKNNNRRASMSAFPLGGDKGAVGSHDEEDEDNLFNRVVPPRSSSYGNPRGRYTQEAEVDEYGYEIDPQLPPPPAPSGPSKKALQNRRGSTGTGLAAFVGSSWNRASGRRGSTATSVATSNVTDATDLASNQQNRAASSSYYYQHHPQLQPQKRADSPEPDLLGTPQSTPQQQGRSLAKMPQGLSLSPSPSDENPTPLQSNRKVRDGMFNASLSGTIGDSSALLDDMSLDMDSSEGSHQKVEKNDPLSGRRASTHTQRASLVQLDKPLRGGRGGVDGGGPVGRKSVLGFNPYGNKAFGHSESEDEDEDEDEEDDNNVGEFKHESKPEGSNSVPPEEAPKRPDEGKTDTPASQNKEASPTDKESQTSGALTAGALAATSGTVTTEDDDDDHSNGSMTSEAPQEGIPKVSLEDEGPMDAIEEIGATGDWSQGAQDYMYQSTQMTKKNSLLDRYPGSVDDDEYLGYGDAPKDPMNAFDHESERKDSGDIADLYAEDYSSLTWRERHVRSLETMEFIDMEKMSKAKNTKGLYLPTFIPAHGCSNASDFIVRCFVARLRAGVTVEKHSKSRWAKSHDRIIHILPTGYHITWIPTTEEEAIAKSTKKAPTKLDLTKCLEVRHAWSRDPKAKRYTGTATLRSKCKEGTANRSFALIYRDRTIDFTARTVDQCKILMEGFSALCFRLQMAKLEQQGHDDDTHATGASGIEIDDDSTTASLTTTNISAPWGL